MCGVSLKSAIPNWTMPTLNALYSWSAPLGNKPPAGDRQNSGEIRHTRTGREQGEQRGYSASWAAANGLAWFCFWDPFSEVFFLKRDRLSATGLLPWDINNLKSWVRHLCLINSPSSRLWSNEATQLHQVCDKFLFIFWHFNVGVKHISIHLIRPDPD